MGIFFLFLFFSLSFGSIIENYGNQKLTISNEKGSNIVKDKAILVDNTGNYVIPAEEILEKNFKLIYENPSLVRYSKNKVCWNEKKVNSMIPFYSSSINSEMKKIKEKYPEENEFFLCLKNYNLSEDSFLKNSFYFKKLSFWNSSILSYILIVTLFLLCLIFFYYVLLI